MDQGFSRISGQEPTDAANAVELEGSSFTHCSYMGGHEKCTVYDDTKTTGCRTGAKFILANSNIGSIAMGDVL